MAISKIENNSLATGVPSTAKLPAGTVLQVVNATYSTETSTSSSSWAATGLSASITPTSATSKILVLLTFSETGKTNGHPDNSLGLRLLKNGSVLQQFTNAVLYTGNTMYSQNGTSFNFLDSPATTSATTYTVQFRNLVNAAAVYVQSNGMPSTITLMEVAA